MTERSVVIRDWGSEKELTAQGHKKIWKGGLIEMFYIINVVVVTCLYLFVKTNQVIY